MSRRRPIRGSAETDDEITEKELLDMSSKIEPSDYWKVGDELGFAHAELDNKKRMYLGNIQESMYQLLITWKRNQVGVPGANVREKLTQHLHAAGLDRDGNRLIVRHMSSKRSTWMIIAAAVICIVGSLLIIRHVTGCASSPCLNGGTCSNLWVRYSCRCSDGFGGSRCEIEYVIDTLTVEEFQDLLREEYERRLFNIHIRPWDSYDYVQLKNLFTVVNLYKTDKDNKPDKPAQRITLNGSTNDVFQTRISGKLPMRILMVGEAGRGKTTAVAKMAYDWAYKLDGSPLKDVPLLFVLKMRHMDKKTGLTEGIVRLLGKKYIKYETQLKDYIDSHEKDVVILFDGYDEYSGHTYGMDTASDVKDILRHDSCKRCRVLVTTRPFRESDFNFGDPVSVYVKMGLEGYSHEHAMNFIDRFFNNSDPRKANELKRYLEDEPIMTDIITTPLFCTMVCYMWNENLLHGSYTRTTFFDNIMNFLWKHARSKKDINRMTTIEQLLNLDTLLTHVGQVAFFKLRKGVEEDMLLFSYKDFNNNMTYTNLSFKIGLLTTTIKLDDDRVFIEFFHKLAQEYSAGKYLSHTLNDSIATLSEDLTLLKEVLRFASGSSDLFCEKIVDTIILNGPLDTLYTDPDLILYMISEANDCTVNIESNLTSIFRGMFYMDKPSLTTVTGFEKLPTTVKNEIIDIQATDLTTNVFRQLWRNLYICTRLRSLEIRNPVLPTMPRNMLPLPLVKKFTSSFRPAFDSPDMDVEILSLLPNLEEFRDTSDDLIASDKFTKLWNKLSSLSHLSNLHLHIPPIAPSDLNPIPSVRVFQTNVELSQDSFLRILLKLPSLKELTITLSIADLSSPDSFSNMWNNLSVVSHLHRLVLDAPPPMTSFELSPIPSVRAFHIRIKEPLDSFVRILSKLHNINELFIDQSGELSPARFCELWNNLTILSHLRRLTLSMSITFPHAELKPLTSVTSLECHELGEESHPDTLLNVLSSLPNIQELAFINLRAFNTLHREESTKLFRKFWRILHSYTNLTRLMIFPPHYVPHELEPLTNVKSLEIVMMNELERLVFMELLPRFPAVQELILYTGTSDNRPNIIDICLAASVDSVMRNNLSLKLFNLTMFSNKHEETILHDTVAKFINMLKSSPEIQTVIIVDIYKCAFKDFDLLQIVKAVRSIPSLLHLGISCVFSLKSELYHYVSQNSIPDDIVSTMELSEQRKSFIKLTLQRSGDHIYMTNPLPGDVWFLRRL